MKRNIQSFVLSSFIVCFLFFSTSCKKSAGLNACITASAASLPIGQVDTFTSCSSGATSYSWNFGDGTPTVNTAVATHTFSTASTFTVALTASLNGQTSIKTTTVVVTTPPTGIWSFKGTNDTAGHCTAASGTLQSSISGSLIVCSFFNNVLPTTSGNYTVTQALPSATNQIEIALNYGGNAYLSTGGNGSNQTVSVTLIGGKVSLLGSGIEMVNAANYSDSASLNFAMTEQ